MLNCYSETSCYNGLRCTQKSKIRSGWYAKTCSCQVVLGSCSNKYNMSLMNIRRRIKTIPKWPKNDLRFINQPKQDFVDMRYGFSKSGVPPNSVLFVQGYHLN